jgi:hypothetical protein
VQVFNPKVGAGFQPAQKWVQVFNNKWVQVFNLHESGCRFSTCTGATLDLDSPQVKNLRPLRRTFGHFQAVRPLRQRSPKKWVQVFNLHKRHARPGLTAG